MSFRPGLRKDVHPPGGAMGGVMRFFDQGLCAYIPHPAVRQSCRLQKTTRPLDLRNGGGHPVGDSNFFLGGENVFIMSVSPFQPRHFPHSKK